MGPFGASLPSLGQLLHREFQFAAHLLPACFGSAPDLSCSRRDLVAFLVSQPAKHSNHHAAGAEGYIGIVRYVDMMAIYICERKRGSLDARGGVAGKLPYLLFKFSDVGLHL